MNKIVRVDAATHCFDIHPDLSVTSREIKPGPPERIHGMTVGIVTMEQSAPHGGEVHPDGDEILYVISGRVRVIGESSPDSPVELGAGESCVVRSGEWHKVQVMGKTQLIHITPGPSGDHRPL